MKEVAHASYLEEKDMFTSNLKLVMKIAFHYGDSEVDTLDLIQEGNLGLLQAITKFDESLGLKFSTYAVYWIKQFIVRYIEKKGRIIQLPVNKQAEIKILKEAKEDLTKNLFREPSLKEISKKTNIPIEKVCELIQLNFLMKDTQILDSSEYYTTENDIESQIMESEKFLIIEETIKNLKNEDKVIIENIYGFGNNQELSINKLSKKLNVNRETLRRKQNNLIDKIKRNFV
jgi:RNA polymerase primary sigma factor